MAFGATFGVVQSPEQIAEQQALAQEEQHERNALSLSDKLAAARAARGITNTLPGPPAAARSPAVGSPFGGFPANIAGTRDDVTFDTDSKVDLGEISQNISMSPAQAAQAAHAAAIAAGRSEAEANQAAQNAQAQAAGHEAARAALANGASYTAAAEAAQQATLEAATNMGMTPAAAGLAAQNAAISVGHHGLGSQAAGWTADTAATVGSRLATPGVGNQGTFEAAVAAGLVDPATGKAFSANEISAARDVEANNIMEANFAPQASQVQAVANALSTPPAAPTDLSAYNGMVDNENAVGHQQANQAVQAALADAGRAAEAAANAQQSVRSPGDFAASAMSIAADNERSSREEGNASSIAAVQAAANQAVEAANQETAANQAAVASFAAPELGAAVALDSNPFGLDVNKAASELSSLQAQVAAENEANANARGKEAADGLAAQAAAGLTSALGGGVASIAGAVGPGLSSVDTQSIMGQAALSGSLAGATALSPATDGLPGNGGYAGATSAAGATFNGGNGFGSFGQESVAPGGLAGMASPNEGGAPGSDMDYSGSLVGDMSPAGIGPSPVAGDTGIGSSTAVSAPAETSIGTVDNDDQFDSTMDASAGSRASTAQTVADTAKNAIAVTLAADPKAGLANLSAPQSTITTRAVQTQPVNVPAVAQKAVAAVAPQVKAAQIRAPIARVARQPQAQRQAEISAVANAPGYAGGDVGGATFSSIGARDAGYGFAGAGHPNAGQALDVTGAPIAGAQWSDGTAITFGIGQEAQAFGNPGEGPGGEGNGKIVCTAMNEDYGFGSYRNAIWLQWAEGRNPAYQRGYHRLFKAPLAWSRKQETATQRVTYKLLQHIARRRTADLRMLKYGRRDYIGAAWRAVLEPLCFVAGLRK